MSRCYSVEVAHVLISHEVGGLCVNKNSHEEPIIYADLGQAIRSLVDRGFIEFPKDWYPTHRPNLVWHGRGSNRDENGRTMFGSIYAYKFIS